MTPTDVDTLVEGCKRRDPAACEELYRMHAARVFNLACRFTGDQAQGEDLLQEIFVQVFRKIGSFKGEAAIGTWIYRLAMNHCLDYVRSRQARQQLVTDALDERTSAPHVDARPIRAERIDLERAIARLPDGYRAAFLLHDVEGFEHHEVAALLGIAEGTSKSQVHKARLKIREYLSGGATGPRTAATPEGA